MELQRPSSYARSGSFLSKRAPSNASGRASTPRGSKKRGTTENIRVAVRVRPGRASQSEGIIFVAEHSAKAILEIDTNDSSVVSTWDFDHVFDGVSSTQEVYSEVGEPLVERGLEGTNTSLLAYGQTASGKTHTLMGNLNEPGIVPLAIGGIFDAISVASYSKIVVRVSYIEVYNEELVDLFCREGDRDKTEARGARLKIVEDPLMGPWVKGSVQAVASSASHALKLIELGEQQRSYGATNMNEHSSRSHVLFRVTVKRGFTASADDPARRSSHNPLASHGMDGNGGVVVDETGPEWEQSASVATRVSALNFVDLAGSERLKKTGATGQALKEANSINTSLMALGTVIAKLSSGEKAHIPYRDSKLTHLLSSSIGGNSLTTMVACVSPHPSDREESVNTLRYASRASKISNGDSTNDVTNMESFMALHQAEVETLRAQLAAAEASKVVERQLGGNVDPLQQHAAHALESELSAQSEAWKMEREELLHELDILHEKLDEERARNMSVGGTVGNSSQNVMDKHLGELAHLNELLSQERAAAAERVEALMQQLAAASKGDMEVVHAALRDEVKDQRAESARLAKLLAQKSVRGTFSSQGKTTAVLARQLTVAEASLKEAQSSVAQLRGEVARAQQDATAAGRAMAQEINALRKELRGLAASHAEHSNFDVPEGYVLWFHAHSLPRIFALAEPENAHVLLRPHASAPVAARNLPLGVFVEVDGTAVAVARQANPALAFQLARLVPASLSEKGFWLHYFSHVHAIKAHVASQARARSEQMGGGLDPQLRDTFSAVMTEGVLVRRHLDDDAASVVLTKLSLDGDEALSLLADGNSNPESFRLSDLTDVVVGKPQLDEFGEDMAPHAISELSFCLVTHSGVIVLESSARLERQALVEGFRMLLRW